MTRLVNNLLTLARLDADPADMLVGAVDLGALLRDVAASASLLHPGRLVTYEPLSGTVIVRGDPDRLRQVVANLLDNALKFTHAGGHIVLALRTETGDAVMHVRDDGVGIPPEDLPHVGERFYRADKARDRESGGAGLGLSIVQAIVAAHDGSLGIQSAPGRGTTVTIRLPLLGDDVQTPTASTVPATLPD